MCLSTTHVLKGHISRPTWVGVSHSCFQSLNKLIRPGHIVQVRGLIYCQKLHQFWDDSSGGLYRMSGRSYQIEEFCFSTIVQLTHANNKETMQVLQLWSLCWESIDDLFILRTRGGGGGGGGVGVGWGGGGLYRMFGHSYQIEESTMQVSGIVSRREFNESAA